MEPTDEVRVRVERMRGRRAVSWRPVQGGYGPTERWVAGFDDGSAAFCKLGSDLDEGPARAIRREAWFLACLPEGLGPRMLGFEDEPVRPLLMLEDLSHAFWPPPWSPERIDRVLDAFARVHALPAPDGARPAEGIREKLAGWDKVASDPGPFLTLGLASTRWTERWAPVLHEAESRAPLDGTAMLHFDVRSDNICFLGGRAMFVDWTAVAAGNPQADIAAWLPSLRAEGGPAPETILTGVGEIAALIAGYFAAHAALPVPFPGGERLRAVQKAQLLAALPWAVHELGIEPLDGPHAP